MKTFNEWSALLLAIIFVLLTCWITVPASAGFVSVQNTHIGLSVGRDDEWDLQIAHSLIPNQPIAGRFCIWAVGGDPTVGEDDYSDIIWQPFGPGAGAPGDKWGAVQIMVDGYDDEGNRMWAPFEVGGTSGIWGDENDGIWDVMPHIRTDKHNMIYGSWYPVSTEDPPGLIPIKCEQTARLMHNTVRFEWKLTNEDIVDHYVGMRIYCDFTLGDGDYGTRDRLMVVSIPGYPIIEEKTLLSVGQIPPVIEMFDSVTNPLRSIRVTFQGSGATMPDKVGIDDWPDVAGSGWTYGYALGQGGDPWLAWLYEPIKHTYINDVAYGAFWKPRRLMPGQSRTIVHYIGLACSSAQMSEPSERNIQYCAAVHSPRCLKYIGAGSSGMVYPDPFTITAYLENLEPHMDFTNASFTLILPPGLELDPSENNHYTKTLVRVPAKKEASVSWKVRVTGSPRGIMNFSVAFSAYPGVGTTVTRTINIPAAEKQPLSWRWQMISVPFELMNSEPKTALGLVGEEWTPENRDGSWRLLGYDPVTMQWEEPVNNLVPGKGYYLWLARPQTVSLTPGNFVPREWAGTKGFHIPLKQGWNMVGNPYIYAMTFGEIRFYHADCGVLDYDEAVAKGLISRTIFSWNATFQRWDMYSKRDAQLKPWQGYWIRALRSGVDMIVTPEAQIGAGIGGEIPPEDTDGGPTPPPTP
ncbi:MAG: hypothetical protein K6T99_01905 [Armatimonadetes bacterium]|nr:hypothetical protein [Armatimonadota bacterium]